MAVETLIPICACSLCGVRAIVPLTPEQLAEQPDATTHVCHPALGGCNFGFVLEPGQYWPPCRPGLEKAVISKPSRDNRRKALFETAPVCMVCEKPIRSINTAVLWTSEDGSDALVHGSNGSDCYLKAVRESVDRYRATPHGRREMAVTEGES